MKALLLIDFQRGLCDSGDLGAEIERCGVLENARTALEAARGRNIGIAHVRLAFRPGYDNRTNRTERFDGHETHRRFLLGSPGTEFRSEVAPAEGETVMEKGSVSPFASTPLLGQYAARGVREIYLAGVATHLAVESAVREAADRGFRVTVIEDACAAPTRELHEHALSVLVPMMAEAVTAAAFAKG